MCQEIVFALTSLCVSHRLAYLPIQSRTLVRKLSRSVIKWSAASMLSGSSKLRRSSNSELRPQTTSFNRRVGAQPIPSTATVKTFQLQIVTSLIWLIDKSGTFSFNTFMNTHKKKLVRSSASDPEWIRIRIQEGKWHKKEKNLKFHFLKCWMFLLRAEGFSCSLDVFYGGLGDRKVQFLSKNITFFQLWICSIFGHQISGPDTKQW